MEQQQRTHKTFWFIVIGAAFWGINPLFRLLLLDTMTSLQIVFIEHIILAFIAIPILWKFRTDLSKLAFRDIGALLFISWGGSAIATLLFTQGLTIASSNGEINSVLLLQKLQPLFAITLAHFLLKERLPKGFGYYVPIALFGTYLLTFGFSVPIGSSSDVLQLGSLFAIGAAALWGGSTVMGRILLKKCRYETVTALRFLLALPLLGVLITVSPDAWNTPATGIAFTFIALNLLASALLPGLVSMLLYYRGLQSVKASVATIAELSFPMTGLLVSWVTLEERVTIAQLIGFALIWIVLYRISRQQDAISTLPPIKKRQTLSTEPK
ncbi:permease [Bacillus sp. JCM 19046]|uniref:Drug/metabolite transporter (DMT)-like permease n=1 Tax=Shouchella xiaoxiensis TaxID=766895 RepID=A0ABS2SY48_9BACI|nr:drug/metabolite transporter (DMT)-like permease [Shouchella xiaoxiensis]GAF14016.1 permease [Bacillus sp. JCM 19045]GAF18411.1 permease [Bacillus sp. JCM 19046]